MNNFESKFKQFLNEGKERPSVAFSDKHYDKEGGDKLRAAADAKKEKMRKLGKVSEGSLNEDYNGWTNYSTWRTALEIFDGWDEDMVRDYTDHEQLEDYVEEALDSNPELAKDYARAFLSDVNYREILRHMRDDHGLDSDEEDE